MASIPVGVSECLLGEPVRYDGGHKRDPLVTEVLGALFELRPVCPEVAIGLGVPREPIRIVSGDQGDRIRGVEDVTLDVTEALADQADRVAELWPDLCGYILMQKSPSCGLFSLPRYSEAGRALDERGRGAFAARLTERMPLLPMEEAGRLTNSALRDSFIARVSALHDWKVSVARAPTTEKLIDFYSRYQSLVAAQHPETHVAISRRLSSCSERDLGETCEGFIHLLMNALGHSAAPGGSSAW